MRVLITVKKNGWSGETAIIMDLARGLRSRGHDVFLAAKKGSITESRAAEEGLPVTNMVFETGPLHVASQWGDFKRLGRFIKENDIDLVHAHASWDHWVAGFTSRKGPVRVPVVRTKHNLKLIRTHPLNRWLYNGLTDSIIAVSKAVSDHLDLCPIVPSSHVRYVPNGIRTDVFRIEDKDPAAVRASIGVDPEEILVAFISRLSERKNPEGFIEAARLVALSGRPIRFVIAGGGGEEYEAALRKRAEDVPNISFLGHWDDVPALLAAIDIFVLPSHIEPFGLAPLEAMAMYKPVVVSEAEGFRDFIVPDSNGIVLDRNEPSDIAEAVLKLADDAALRKRLGEEGRRTVEADFTSDVMVERTIEVYEGGHNT